MTSCEFCPEEDCTLGKLNTQVKDLFRLLPIMDSAPFDDKDAIFKFNRQYHVEMICSDIVIREYRPNWGCVKRYFGKGVILVKPSEKDAICNLIDAVYAVFDDPDYRTEEAFEMAVHDFLKDHEMNFINERAP